MFKNANPRALIPKGIRFLRSRGLLKNGPSHRIAKLQGYIARNAFIDRSVQVLGWDSVRIGAHSVLSENTWLNVNHRLSDQRINIGECCFIGRRNFFSTGGRIIIGDYCMTSIDCSFLGAGHLFDDPTVPYLFQGVDNYGDITIGCNVWLSAHVSIIGNVEIGFGSIIGAGAIVTSSVPPLAMAIGTPARVTRLFDWQDKCWKSVSRDSVTFSAEIARHILRLPAPEIFLARVKAASKGRRPPALAAGAFWGEA